MQKWRISIQSVQKRAVSNRPDSTFPSKSGDHRQIACDLAVRCAGVRRPRRRGRLGLPAGRARCVSGRSPQTACRPSARRWKSASRLCARSVSRMNPSWAGSGVYGVLPTPNRFCLCEIVPPWHRRGRYSKPGSGPWRAGRVSKHRRHSGKSPPFTLRLTNMRTRTSVVDWWGGLTQPGITIGVPAPDLSGQSSGTMTGRPFGQEVVPSCQEPTDVFTCHAIQPPDGPFALC